MIDASIPLQIRPPQFEDPIQSYGKALQLKSLMQQQALGQEQLKGAQMENQQRQVQMDQTQALNSAYQNALTVGPDGTPTIDKGKLTQHLGASGHGSAIPGVLKSMTDFEKSTAELSELRGKVATAEQDYAGTVGAAAKAANYDPHLFLMSAQHAIAAKAVDPQVITPMVQQVQQALQADPTGQQARQMVQQIADHFISQSPKQQELINQHDTAQGGLLRGQAAQSQAERANAAQDLKVASADLATASTPAEYSAKLNALPHGLATKFPAVEQVFDQSGKPTDDGVQRVRFIGMTPAEQSTAVKPQKESNPTEASLARDAKDPTLTPEQRATAEAALKRLDQSKIAARPIIQTVVPGLGPGQGGPGGGAEQVTGDDYLKTLPAGTAAQIRAIAEGRATLPSASSRSQAALQLRDAVFKYDPTFSEQRAQLRKALTTGPDGRNIGALNTATVHLDQLGEVSKAMANGSFRPGNALWNSVRTTFGGATPTNFEGLKNAVAGEMATALKGNATDPEIAHISATIQQQNSPAQLAGFIDTQLHVLGAKLNTYNERYQQQAPGDKWSPVLPSASAVYAKHGINPTAGPGGQGGGATSYSFSATGPNGHKIGSNDGKTWFDAQTGKKVQ